MDAKSLDSECVVYITENVHNLPEKTDGKYCKCFIVCNKKKIPGKEVFRGSYEKCIKWCKKNCKEYRKYQ